MKRVTLLLSIMITAMTAFGQQSGPDAKTEADPFGWKVNWVPFYLWMSGIDGNIGVGGKTAPVGAGFSDSFANLNIGYTTMLDARYDRVGLLTDLAYIDLGSDNTLSPRLLYTHAHSDAKQFFIDPELYARLFESDRGSVDALAIAILLLACDWIQESFRRFRGMRPIISSIRSLVHDFG